MRLKEGWTMENRLKMIFTKEEMERIAEMMRDGKREISIDLHQLTVKQAYRLMKNLIALDREGGTIRVIHGYHRGTAIRDMIRNGLENPRIADWQEPERNPGQTILTINRAA